MPSSNDLIDVNPLCDLGVTFEDIPANYAPGQDVFVIYQLGEDFKPTTKDWVGLYRLGWSDIHQYLAFQWSPKKARNPKFPQIRSALFLAKELKDILSSDGSDRFQFLYIAKGSHIVGVSRRFTISSNPEPQLLQCVDRCVDSLGSLTFIEVVKSNSKGKSSSQPLLEGYDLLSNDEETQPLLNHEEEGSDEEKRIVPWQKWELVPTHGSTQDDWLLTPVSTRKLEDPAVTLNIPDSVYEHMKLVLGQLQTQYSPVERLMGPGARSKCVQCQKRREQVKDLRSEKESLNEECGHMKERLSDSTEIIEMKEWLVTALSDQVKNLVAENSTLHVMKERMEQAQKQTKMCKRCSRMWTKLTTIQSENQRMKQELLFSTQQLQEVQNQRDQLETTSSESEERLRAKCNELEKDLVKLTATLPGSCATWEVAAVSKHSRSSHSMEKVSETLKEKVRELESSVQFMSNEVEDTQIKLRGKDSDYEGMITQRDHLVTENELLNQRIDQLEHGLSVEQRKRCEQVRKYKNVEEDLNERIGSLSAALEDVHLTRRSSKTESTGSQHVPQGNSSSSSSSQTYVTKQSPASSQTQSQFSLKAFLSKGLESLGKHFEDLDTPLIEPIQEHRPILEFLPTPMFDFYPTILPETKSRDDTWSRGLINAPPCVKRPNDFELDGISLGNACNKRKVVFDFRNDDVTKAVVDASDVAEAFDVDTRKVTDQPLDLSSVWDVPPKQEQAPDKDFPALKTGAKKTAQEKCRRTPPKARKAPKSKRPIKTKNAEQQQPCHSDAGNGNRDDDTTIVCPYCEFTFEEATSLTAISRHIEQHHQ